MVLKKAVLAMLRNNFLANLLLLYFIILIAGASLSLALAPYNIWPLGILSPAIVAWIWQRKAITSIQAALLGLIFGFAFFGMSIAWVYLYIHYLEVHVPTATLFTFLFILILASFTCFQGFFLKQFFKGNQLSFYLLGFPSIWVLFEWLRSWLLSGVPWAYIGYHNR